MNSRAEEPSQYLGKRNQCIINPNLYKHGEDSHLCPNTDEESMVEDLVPVEPAPPALLTFKELLARATASTYFEAEDREYFGLNYPNGPFEQLTVGQRELLREMRAAEFEQETKIEPVPTMDEFIDKRVQLHTGVTSLALDRLRKRLAADYEEAYGSVEQQALLFRQRGWKVKKAYSPHPNAIKAREYRERLEENAVGEDIKLREDARVRMKAHRDHKKANRPAAEVEAARQAKEIRKTTRAAEMRAYTKAWKLGKKNTKTGNASTAAPVASPETARHESRLLMIRIKIEGVELKMFGGNQLLSSCIVSFLCVILDSV